MPLLLFKYTGFVVESINSLAGWKAEAPSFIVPVGISFFTFEAISCMCDVYNRRISVPVSLMDMYIYLSFFPTVTSGPICRYDKFRQGLEVPIELRVYESAIERFAVGLIKKMIFADKIAVLADYYFNGIASGREYSALGLWMGSVAYTLQIYFDFSGYTDMAVGLGKMMGFELPENFDNPYQAKSIKEFWKKWHISLSQWFRDYIYIPLGGSRCSAYRIIFNLLTVWLLTGIWHGADWSFVIWGLGYFILLLMEKFIPVIEIIGEKWYGHIYTLLFVNFLWIFFRADNINTALNYIRGMFINKGGCLVENKAATFIPFMALLIFICCPWQSLLKKFYNRVWYKVIRGLVILALFGWAICAIMNSAYAPYIYGNF